MNFFIKLAFGSKVPFTDLLSTAIVCLILCVIFYRGYIKHK
ncbi:hypothetical protein FLA_0233 [Filimonas lacunae]|nr:hypothetical protein FLA_0233 [Filimonas lacunae]